EEGLRLSLIIAGEKQCIHCNEEKGMCVQVTKRERERERGGGGGNPLAVLVGHVDADANLLPRTTRRLPSPSHPLDAAHGFPSVARQPVRAAALPRQLVAPAVGLTASLQPFRLFSYSSGDTFPAVPAVGLRWISSLPAFSSATRDSVYHVPALFPIAVVELRLDLGRGRSRGGRDERYGEYWQQNAPPLADHVVKVPPRPPPPPPFASRPPHPPNHSPPAPPPPMVSGSGGSGSNYSGSEVPLTPPSPGVALGFSKSTFTYDELARATDGFSEANLLGQGGFGYVHRGVLPNGKEVAVKQLKTGSGQGEREFQAEVEIISRVHHKHLVSLVGYCISGGRRLLVYEFVPNNTLEFHLHVKIDRRRSIEGEIDRRRSIEEEKGKRKKKKRKRRKKKRRRRRKKKRKSTSPACPHRPRAVAGTDKMSVCRSVTIDFDRRHPLPGGISLAAARLVAAREKEARERGRRRGEQEGEPQMVPPSSGEATARLLETCTSEEPRDDATDEENLAR
ncbi:hypothetical protein BHM03_00043628, partial [Ensete ventricosum]